MKILLPLDDSDCSQKTLQWAAHTFDRTISEYYLLTVVSMPSGYIPAVPEFVPVIADSDVIEYESEHALRVLNQAKRTLRSLGCNVVQAEFIIGDTVGEICNYADIWHVDQVVIGSHGKNGLQQLVMGSTSADVMKRCKKPVLMYRNLQPIEQLVFN